MPDLTCNRAQAVLSHFRAESERSFLHVAAEFPNLLTRLSDDLRVAAHELGELSAAGMDAEGSELDRARFGMRSIQEWSDGHFAATTETDAMLFGELRTRVVELSRLGEATDRLREDSMDMGVLAINAIVSAHSAGERGRGFAYVAAELQRVTTATAAETSAIELATLAAVESLGAFKEDLKIVEESQRELHHRVTVDLHAGLDDLRCAIDMLVSGVTSGIRGAARIEAPLSSIMGQIQIQDIIAQSIAHMQTVLEEFGDSSVHAEGQYFPAATLLRSLVDDTSEKLFSALSVFHESLGEVRDAVSGIRASVEAAVESNESKSLRERFARSVGLLRTIVSSVESSVKDRSSLIRRGTQVLGQFEPLHQHIAALSGLIGSLYPLRVMARIESTRMLAHNGVLGILDDLDAFTVRITADVTRIADTVREATDGLGTAICSYEEIRASESDDTARGIEAIESAVESLSRAEGGLYAVLERLRERADQAGDLVLNAEEQVRLLERRHEETTTVMNEVVATIEREQPSPENFTERSDSDLPTVDVLLDRFTIARHKQSAATLVGREVDKGDREGELTLF